MPARWAKSLADRVAGDTSPSDTGCHEWTGAKNAYGYGVFTYEYKYHYAHRAAFELAGGNIPDGFQINHKCLNRGCVNPEHLEALSHSDHCKVDEPQRMAGFRRWCAERRAAAGR